MLHPMWGAPQSISSAFATIAPLELSAHTSTQSLPYGANALLTLSGNAHSGIPMALSHRLIVLLLAATVVFSNSMSFTAAAAVEPPYGSMGENLSAVYSQKMQSHELPLPSMRNQAGNFFVLFVPGMISDSNIQSAQYFSDFAKVLSRLGMKENDDYVLLSKTHGFDSENSVALNAKAISNFIRQVERPIVLVTHSKGSVDVLEALIGNKEFPQIVSHIHGWLNIQGGIWGTPIADAIEHSGVAKFIADVGMALLGGSGQALTDMTLVSRYKFMSDHWAEVNQLSHEINILSFASAKDYERMDQSIKSLYGAPFIGPVVTGAMKDRVHDGLVPISHALLPGSAFVIAQDTDHADSVTNTDNAQNHFNRSQMSLVLLHLLLG